MLLRNNKILDFWECDFPDICVTIACILRNPLNTVDIRLREPGRRRGGCVLRHRHSAGQGPIVSLQGVDRPSGISCSSGGKRLGYAGSDSCDSFVGLTAIYNVHIYIYIHAYVYLYIYL